MTPLEDLLRGAPLPAADGAKHERGRVVVVGGPTSCPGAALLAGEAALRVGAGRVQLVVHPDVLAAVAVALPEALVLGWDVEGPLPAEAEERLRAADVLLVGPGHQGLAPEAVELAGRLAAQAVLVLDAGALPAAGHVDADRLVVAPNTAEAADLAGTDVAEADGDEPALAEALARRFGRPVAVRGALTAVADPDGRSWASTAAPPGLGTPGSGDVLVGLLAGLLGLGAPPVVALGWAVALHARAGELAALEHPRGYLARDVLAHVPAALSEADGGLAPGAEGNGTSVAADPTRP